MRTAQPWAVRSSQQGRARGRSLMRMASSWCTSGGREGLLVTGASLKIHPANTPRQHLLVAVTAVETVAQGVQDL